MWEMFESIGAAIEHGFLKRSLTRGISCVGQLWGGELWARFGSSGSNICRLGRRLGALGVVFVALGEVWELWESDL